MKIALIFEDASPDQFEVFTTGIQNVKLDFQILDGSFEDLATPALLAAATMHRAAKLGMAVQLFPKLMPEIAEALQTLDFENMPAELAPVDSITDADLEGMIREAGNQDAAAS